MNLAQSTRPVSGLTSRPIPKAKEPFPAMRHAPLILIFGLPRSGTTWLGKIFDSHPDTVYRHEPSSRYKTIGQIPLFAHARDAEQYRAIAEGYIAQLASLQDEKVSASLPMFPKSYYSATALALRKVLALGVKAASQFKAALPVPNLANLAARADLPLVWKSVGSVGRLGVLCTVRPDAKAILLVRHPCGHIASILRGEAQNKFQCRTPSSEDWGLFERLLELPQAKRNGWCMALVKDMPALERLALAWALHNEHALDDTLGMGNVAPMRYEDFCAAPFATSLHAFEHCGLNWNPNTEQFIADSVSGNSAGYYSVFKNPQQSANRWRRELASAEIDRIMAVARQFRCGTLFSE